MPKIGIPRDEVTVNAPVPSGIYEVKLVGFKPAFSKDKNSINLNPKLAIVATNGATFECADPDCRTKHGGHKLDGAFPAWVNLNVMNKKSNTGFITRAFVHMFGLEMEDDVDTATGEVIPKVNIPGDFNGSPDDPTTWVYTGPLMQPGVTGKLEVAQGDNNKGGKRNVVKQFLCKTPGCKEAHPTKLS